MQSRGELSAPDVRMSRPATERGQGGGARRAQIWAQIPSLHSSLRLATVLTDFHQLQMRQRLPLHTRSFRCESLYPP
jgi:hypothetical protein